MGSKYSCCNQDETSDIKIKNKIINKSNIVFTYKNNIKIENKKPKFVNKIFKFWLSKKNSINLCKKPFPKNSFALKS